MNLAPTTETQQDVESRPTTRGLDDLNIPSHPMTEPSVIGEVRSHEGYEGLHALFRLRADQLGVPRSDPKGGMGLDALSGLADGYVAKLLSPVPMKTIGRLSLGPLMSALAVKLIMVEDLEMLARIERKIGKQIARRAVKGKHAGGGMLASNKPKRRRFRPLKGNNGWGQMMRARQLLTQSGPQRSRIARQAAKARWRTPA
jgi:hypothetical protein